MVVDRGFHQTCQTKVIHHIDVENAHRVLSLLHCPVVKKHFDGLSVALRACDMQGVASIRIVEIYVHIFLQEKLYHVQLVFSGRD